MNRLRLAALAAIAALIASLIPVDAQQGPQSSSAPLNAAATSAACTSQSCVTLALVPLSSQVGCWVEVTGTFTGTLLVEGSLAGSQWVTASVTPFGGSASSATTTITADGLYQTACAPNTRVRMSAYTSGTATVALYATNIEPYGGVVNDQAINFWPTNAPGGGCSGVTTGGVAISSSNVTQTWTTTTTTFIAGSASKTTHICDFEISGVPTTGGTISVIVGTSANCAAGTATAKSYTLGVNSQGFIAGFNNGGADLFAVPSGDYVCLGGASFAGTITANATYAQY